MDALLLAQLPESSGTPDFRATAGAIPHPSASLASSQTAAAAGIEMEWSKETAGQTHNGLCQLPGSWKAEAKSQLSISRLYGNPPGEVTWEGVGGVLLGESLVGLT